MLAILKTRCGCTKTMDVQAGSMVIAIPLRGRRQTAAWRNVDFMITQTPSIESRTFAFVMTNGQGISVYEEQ